ncbi:uncharacterized protein LOC115895676 [Rhinopithecus roxellana]|uniref:uncharacterized protein LOC115895676 n=1 Tax=Rhinopithecus roxellana TaxID=61622 RepID=UPI0012373135|nr:uncharacterized protein LOC115895676 [Rhinopithecus roxellana]
MTNEEHALYRGVALGSPPRPHANQQHPRPTSQPPDKPCGPCGPPYARDCGSPAWAVASRLRGQPRRPAPRARSPLSAAGAPGIWRGHGAEAGSAGGRRPMPRGRRRGGAGRCGREGGGGAAAGRASAAGGDAAPEWQVAEATALVHTLDGWSVVQTMVVSTKSPDRKLIFGKGNFQHLTERTGSRVEVFDRFTVLHISGATSA